MTAPALGYLLLARAEAKPETAAAWYHTVPPPGEYPSVVRQGGKKRPGTLVIDDLAYDRILAGFRAAAAREGFAGLIVDREHRSELPDGDSEAAAWALEMERRPDGLWTRWDLTSLGASLLGGRNYKYRSPAFDLEAIPGTRDRWRPVELRSIGLTNTPHFKMLAPSLNRGGSEEEDYVTMIDRLRAILALPPEADEEAIAAAVEAAVNKGKEAEAKAATAEARVTALETAEREREADAFISLHSARIQDKATVRERYLRDPEGCKALFGALGEPARQPRMLGKDAGTPAGRGEERGAASRTRERAALVSTIQQRDGVKRTVALARAERERPDLFGKAAE